MTVEELKHILFNLDTIQKLYEQSKLMIEVIDYRMEGVKGIMYHDEPTRISVDRQKRLIELMMKKDKVVLKQEYYSDMLNEVQRFINSLQGQEKAIVISRFKHGKAINDIADNLSINTRTVYRIINETIRNYCDKEDEC